MQTDGIMSKIPSNYYVTTFYQQGSVVLYFDKDNIIIKNLPAELNKSILYMDLVNHCDEVVASVGKIKLNKKIKIEVPSNGIYFLRLFYKEDLFNYNGFLFRRDVPFMKKDESYIFVNTIVTRLNHDFYDSLPIPSPKLIKHKRIRLTSLVKEITIHCASNYEKILAIHDWIAGNIFYDMDLLNKDKADWVVDPISVLELKRSVCQGYTNLSISMLNIINIPAVGITCYALDENDNLGWANPFSLSADSSHIITAAWANRWIMMDITWDSPNKYQNGKFSKQKQPLHKYFDTTIPFISNTHRLISVEY